MVAKTTRNWHSIQTGRGSAAVYGPGHRDRLRRLQEAHLPLAAIRTHLEALDDAGVAAAYTG